MKIERSVADNGCRRGFRSLASDYYHVINFFPTKFYDSELWKNPSVLVLCSWWFKYRYGQNKVNTMQLPWEISTPNNILWMRNSSVSPIAVLNWRSVWRNGSKYADFQFPRNSSPIASFFYCRRLRCCAL